MTTNNDLRVTETKSPYRFYDGGFDRDAFQKNIDIYKNWREKTLNHFILSDEECDAKDNPNGIFASVEFIAIVDKLKEKIKDNYLIKIGYSAGKDSSVLLLSYTVAMMELKIEGFTPKFNGVVVHIDTLIEQPLVSNLAKNSMYELSMFIKQNGLNIDLLVGRPAFSSSFIGRVISGRGLPTTVASTVRQCAIDLKVTPSNSTFKKHLKSLNLKAAKEPKKNNEVKVLLLLGSRDDEGALRAASIKKFGGTNNNLDITFIDDLKLNPKKEYGAYVLKSYTTQTIWNTLQFAGTDEGKVIPSFMNNYDETVRVYADSMGSCVYFDFSSADESQQTEKCSARHGCFACQAVGQSDKSMENLLSTGNYEYLRSLSRIRDYISKTHWDWGERRPFYRSIDKDGYAKVQPNTYSFDKCKRILHAMITADCLEQYRAEDLAYMHYSGERCLTPSEMKLMEPQFQHVTKADVVMLDFLWAFDQFAPRPYEALKIWNDVYEKGIYDQLLDVDDMPFVPKTTQPKEMFLYVGDDWSMNGLNEGFIDRIYDAFDSFRDSMNLPFDDAMSLDETDYDHDMGLLDFIKSDKFKLDNHELKSGSVLVESRNGPIQMQHIETSNTMMVNADAMEYYFLDADFYLKKNEGYTPISAALSMAQSGTIYLANGKQVKYNEMAQRQQWMSAKNLLGSITYDEVLARNDLKLFTKKEKDLAIIQCNPELVIPVLNIDDDIVIVSIFDADEEVIDHELLSSEQLLYFDFEDEDFNTTQLRNESVKASRYKPKKVEDEAKQLGFTF